MPYLRRPRGLTSASHQSWETQLAVSWLGFAAYRAPLDVRRVGGALAGDRAPPVLGHEARLEQLETAEEAG